MKKLMTALAVIAVAAASQAALIAHEGFNYTAAANLNTLPGATGGTTWPATGLATTNWSGGTVTSSGLSYTGIQSAGNAAQPLNNGTVNYRNIGNSTLQNKTFWFSVLFNSGNATTSTTTDRFILGTWGTSSGYGIGFEVKDTSAGAKTLNSFYGSVGGGSTAQVDSTATQSLTGGNTYLVIGKVTLTAAGTGSESLSLWLNPASFASEGALGTANISQSGDFRLGWDYTTAPNMAIGIQGSADTILFDEIRIGDNVADVIPEPATIGLVGFFGGAILLVRRFRNRG